MSTVKQQVKVSDQVDDNSLASEDYVVEVYEISDRQLEDHGFEADDDEESEHDRLQFSCDAEEIAFDMYINELIEDRRFFS